MAHTSFTGWTQKYLRKFDCEKRESNLRFHHCDIETHNVHQIREVLKLTDIAVLTVGKTLDVLFPGSCPAFVPQNILVLISGNVITLTLIRFWNMFRKHKISASAVLLSESRDPHPSVGIQPSQNPYVLPLTFPLKACKITSILHHYVFTRCLDFTDALFLSSPQMWW